jgi:hypothetical protein
MRVVFMGTPDFSVPVLDALVDAGHEIACVYCQPPRPAGRGKKDRPSPVQKRAEALGLPVRHPVSLKSPGGAGRLRRLGADVGVVVAYGLILPQAVLDAPRHGCLNIHASLLPRWRGAAPIQRAIMAGDAETGVCIMQMEAGLDTGPCAPAPCTAIGAEETAGELHDRLSASARPRSWRRLRDLPSLTPEPQPEEGVTYARRSTRPRRPSTGAATPWRSTGPSGAFRLSRGVDHGRRQACEAAARAGRGRDGCARDRPGRGEDRLRRRRGGVDRGATGRKIAYVCGGVAARCPPAARDRLGDAS